MLRPLRGLLLAGLIWFALPVAGAAQAEQSANQLVAQAGNELARGDGIAAEITLKRAIGRGAKNDTVSAAMGEAYFLQGDRAQARKWLEPGGFAKANAGAGFRTLGRLEMAEGNLPAAGRAFDKALATTPRDAAMWVDIAELRYRGGEQVQAIEAVDFALSIEPQNVRGLSFRARLVRDQFGLLASLSWFEAALAAAPGDVETLGEYAATLGELDRARDMLAVTRRMLQLDGRNPRALYLQAVLAARAGDDALARSMLNRTGERLSALPGAMLLDAVIAMRAGNHILAIDTLERLLARQPGNVRARTMLARSMFLAGQHKALISRFGGEAGVETASPYLLTLMGRSWEILGDRARAAPFLDRAATAPAFFVQPVVEGSQLGALIAQGRLAQAQALAETNRRTNPASATYQMAAGDVQLAMGNGREALERYGAAARVRMPESLMQRMLAAYLIENDRRGAAVLVETYLARNPSSTEAAWLAGRLALAKGDWRRARLLLRYVEQSGSGRSVAVLTELSLAEQRSGNAAAGTRDAAKAYRLQRASGPAAAAWGFSLASSGGNAADAAALLTKAHKLTGDSALLAEGRKLLRPGKPG